MQFNIPFPFTNMNLNRRTNNLHRFNERQKLAMNDIAQTDGFGGLCRYINENRNAWQGIKIDIAITGQAGTGKSSLVNALLHLRPNQPGGAIVGIAQGTVTPTPHCHRQHPRFTVWDLPGVGVPDFPRETYLEQVNYQKYDVFIIVGSERFTENDTWLLTEATRRGIKTYFVRAKVHQDINNQKNYYPETFDAEHSLQQIRDACMKSLSSFDNVQLFLIDSKKINMYDLNELRRIIYADENNLGKEVFVRLFESVAEQCLQTTRDTLKANILKVSTVSAGLGAIPYGLGIIADVPLLAIKMAEYKRCFGLDDASLQHIANIRNMPLPTLLRTVSLRFLTIVTVNILLESASSTAAISSVNAYAARSVLSNLPIIGTAITAPMSFGMTYYALKTFVDMLHTDALTLMNFVSRSLTENQ